MRATETTLSNLVSWGGEGVYGGYALILTFLLRADLLVEMSLAPHSLGEGWLGPIRDGGVGGDMETTAKPEVGKRVLFWRMHGLRFLTS